MEVGRILAPGSIDSNLLKQLRPGDRLLVEVIQKTGEREGTIRVNGQDVFALLETSTELGEKFWVKVANANQGNLLLVREPIVEKQGDIHELSQQLQQIRERGFPIHPEIIALLREFPKENPGFLSSLSEIIQGKMTDEFLANLRKSIPEWANLSEENGAEELVECLRKLGLNYEQRIQQMLKLESHARETEKNSLKDTFKFALLEAIQKQAGRDHDSKGPLAQLLQKLTGQQLWFKTGTLDNAYMLLHLPLLNQGQPIPVQIAIESARKGSKMDAHHCRVAIQIETLEFGEIGIDAFFDQDSLALRVLTREQQVLPELIEEVMDETRAKFSKLGFNIVNVETGNLDKAIEFQNFLKGLRRSGVDIKR
ncbi:hypothetical protein [Desulfosporosinus sp. Sb-LF]|uniref:hypothetical protein n=1 Tax=Desulfosporosinus sp. Sb-LF TaxID=2560027 RepID=UPI00107F7FD0|nr:hypothetical protein [Desulfosporosinus sp. Sb-LF]TGE32334.1 hypothetical protein E4K68_12060 [Desulfosporosinus sp. Sb-LF]